MSDITAKLTTLADCAHRFNQLCRSENLRSKARCLVADVQAADDEFRKGVSDWQKRKRHYFEVEAIADDELLDDASHYGESDLHWQSYTRVVYVAELGSVPSGMSDTHFRALPYYDSPGGTRPTESLPAGVIEITAWAPTEFLDCNSPNPQLPLPPENIGRAYRLGEIVTALVAIHDADGRFEPIVPKDDPIHKGWLFDIFGIGWVGSQGRDEWAPALEPLLARVEAEWTKLVEPTEERGGLGFKEDDEEAEPEALPQQSMSVDEANKEAKELANANTPVRLKKSTQKGEVRVKLISALTKHHEYADDGCLNWEAIGNNELARQAGVDQATASLFFKKEFKGHDKYKAWCWNNKSGLIAALKLLNQEFSPHQLYGAKPPGEGEDFGEE